MKLIEWLKRFLGYKCIMPASSEQTDGFIIIDSQYHIHTREKIEK